MKFQKLSLEDSSYPELLRNIYDPPKFFNIWGKLPDFNEHPPIAIVGSRKPTDYGIENTKELSKGLTNAGFVIISGLAYGIDSISHKSCLENNGTAVAVLGSGLKNIYPPTHKKLAEEIVEKSGAVISEYDDTMPALPCNFPMRNRIISGLSLGIIVVEAAIDSGALITARSALEQGREVFAVPGAVGNVNTAGTHRLIREGAALIESAQDVIDLLENKLSKGWKIKFSGQSFGIGDKERKLLDFFTEIPLTMDNLIEKSGFTAQEVIASITMLECAGLLKEDSGRGYVRLKTHD